MFRAHVRDGEPPVVVLVGEADLAAAPELRRALRAAVGAGRVEVDATAVTFIDSVGVGLLVGGARRVRDDGGDLLVVVAPGRVHDTLVATGVDRVITIEVRDQP